jgi:hypothetical protein
LIGLSLFFFLATLPEGMTLEKWMMQQRNFTEEERRKRNDAANFLHSYRGKNVPGSSTTNPKSTTTNKVDGPIPPGPDEQAPEVTNMDIKGIVAEFEKITTTTTSPPRNAADKLTTPLTDSKLLEGDQQQQQQQPLTTTDEFLNDNTDQRDQEQDLYDITADFSKLVTTNVLVHDEYTTSPQATAEEVPPAVPHVEEEEEKGNILLEGVVVERQHVVSTNVENSTMQDPTVEQIQSYDDPTTLLEVSQPQLVVKASREEPQARRTEPQSTELIPDLQVVTSTTTTTTSNSSDHPMLAAHQQDVTPYDENSINNNNNNNILISKQAEEVNNNNNNNLITNTLSFANQCTPTVGSSKKVDVKVLLAVHVKKEDAVEVLSGGKQSVLESVIHVTENIVKKSIASSPLLDATGTFYDPTFRPTIDSVEADSEFYLPFCFLIAHFFVCTDYSHFFHSLPKLI